MQVFEYEYEEDMEESYRGNLVRSFKKTLEDGYFTFVIMDAINDKLKYFSDCYKTAKANGFEVWKYEYWIIVVVRKVICNGETMGKEKQ